MGCCSALVDIVYNLGRWLYRSTLFFIVVATGFGTLPYYGPPAQAFLASVVYYPQTLYRTVRDVYGIPMAAFVLVLFLTCSTYLYEHWLHESVKQRARSAWTWLRTIGRKRDTPAPGDPGSNDDDDQDDDQDGDDDDDDDDDDNNGGDDRQDNHPMDHLAAEFKQFMAWKRKQSKRKKNRR